MKTQGKKRNRASIFPRRHLIIKSNNCLWINSFRCDEAFVLLKPEQITEYRRILRDPETFRKIQNEMARVNHEVFATRIGNSASK